MPIDTVPFLNPDETGHITEFIPAFLRGKFKPEALRSFRKCPHQILDFYAVKYQGNRPLIGPLAVLTWLKVCQLAVGLELFSAAELADAFGVDAKTLRAALDELEDVELIERYRLNDTRGQRLYIIPCTPVLRSQFPAHFTHLFRHRAENTTAKEREDVTRAGRLWPTRTLSHKQMMELKRKRELQERVRQIQGEVLSAAVGARVAPDLDELDRRVIARALAEGLGTRKEIIAAINYIRERDKL